MSDRLDRVDRARALAPGSAGPDGAHESRAAAGEDR
jgi:hypothetical protein